MDYSWIVPLLALVTLGVFAVWGYLSAVKTADISLIKLGLEVMGLCSELSLKNRIIGGMIHEFVRDVNLIFLLKLLRRRVAVAVVDCGQRVVGAVHHRGADQIQQTVGQRVAPARGDPQPFRR